MGGYCPSLYTFENLSGIKIAPLSFTAYVTIRPTGKRRLHNMDSQLDNSCLLDESDEQKALMETLAVTVHHFFGEMAKDFSRNYRPA